MSAIPIKANYVADRISDAELAAEVAKQLQRIMAGQSTVLDRLQQAAVDETAEYIVERKS